MYNFYRSPPAPVTKYFALKIVSELWLRYESPTNAGTCPYCGYMMVRIYLERQIQHMHALYVLF